MPDTRAYVSNMIFGMKLATPKIEGARRKRVANHAIEGKYVYVGSKAWNDLYNQYEWNGHEFGEKRQRHLPGYLNTVEKRREMRRNKAFERFDRKVSQGRLSDVIDSSLGYALTYYHTVQEDMYKEWVKEKRTKKDFRATTVYPFCHKKLEDNNVRHHAHVAGEYTTGNGGICSFKAGPSAPAVPSAISSYHSTRKTIVYPHTSTTGRTTTSHSS